MDTAIVVAIITSVGSLLGVILTVRNGNKKQEKMSEENKQLILYRINQLELKQDKHNSLMERTFKLEGKVIELKEEMKSVRNSLLNNDNNNN